MRGLVLGLCLLCPALAGAGDAFLPRPVWVPAKSLSAELIYSPAYASAEGQSATAHTLMADVKYGVLDGLEVGLTGGIDLNGELTSRRVGLEVEGSPSSFFAARLDATGYWLTVPSFDNPGSSTTDPALALGFGETLRFPIGHGLALISGRSIGRPPLGYGGVYSFGDDFLTIDFNNRNVFASFSLPYGLAYEPIPGVAFELRSGFRHVWGGGDLGADFFPLGVDGLFNLTRNVDLVATVELPGQTGYFFNLVQGFAAVVVRY